MAKKDMPDMEKVRHSLAHIMALAVLEKYPEAKLGIGPTIENGFYYDFDFGKKVKFADSDLSTIEKRMKEFLAQGLIFKKQALDSAQAKKIFKFQPYKAELVKDLLKEKKKLSAYGVFNSNAGKKDAPLFLDLCAGPHVNSTDEIAADAFKLTKTAGAYWKGSEKNQMLTRIYGVAFATLKELNDYIVWQEEAERRDHRLLGERLEFFMIDEKIGKGLPLWLPKGYAVRHILEEYIYNVEKEGGYLHVLTPHLAKEDLYKTSGHLSHYREDMYAPVDIEGERYYLKPMNCPHHHSIYSYKVRSYRDLPLRVAEFGTVYRYERSGVLSGLIRVRGFTQNDAHIYTTAEKLEQEIEAILKMHSRVFTDFRISNYWYRLSLPDFKNKEKYGDVKNRKAWEAGEEVLRRALKRANVKFVEAKGEASFYGPKIDIQIKNIHGKEDTIATIQVDYYSANKFNLSYIDTDGKEKPPVIIHRAIFGSFDRFFAFLLEQTAGNLPIWLSPVQVRIVPVSDKFSLYAEKVLEDMKNAGIRAEADLSGETLGKRVRQAELERIPVVVVVGEREEVAGTLSVRSKNSALSGDVLVADFIDKIRKEIEGRR